jgi:hypothetical protein
MVIRLKEKAEWLGRQKKQGGLVSRDSSMARVQRKQHSCKRTKTVVVAQTTEKAGWLGKQGQQ